MRVLLLSTMLTVAAPAAPQMLFEAGPVNGVLLEADGDRLAVYGWKDDDADDIDTVLLTHGRRDVVWKAQAAREAGAEVIAPAREQYSLEQPEEFWAGFSRTQFHDYAQQSTKLMAAPITVHRRVSDNDQIQWNGLTIQVVETPGFTRGSVSYVTDVGGRTVAFTGDLIYGDGRIPDLYSFQDAIPEAQIRGYHGYGARLADLVASLKKIAALNPDVIVPARGPIIEDPAESIQRLIGRVQAVYRNYLSTNALHWYFKEERMRQCGERVLGKDAEIQLMPYSHTDTTPPWIFEQATSRLLISESGQAFLLDCGYQRVIDSVKDLIAQNVISRVEGIFVTHYHDDHTDMVQAAAEEFRCPVYATPEYADVLTNPAAYHLPAMTANPIRDIKVLPDGHQMTWHEFDFTFHFFPGQTFYHGALLARRKAEQPVFFIGDAFAPSGFDDYCVLNRNLLHDDTGYLRCLRTLRNIKEPCWLVNEHIPFVFSFSDQELDYLEQRYRQRIELLAQLFPWDDPNYGVDEQWAVFYPRRTDAEAADVIPLEVRLTNHSPKERTFEITVRLPAGAAMVDQAAGMTRRLTLQPRQSSGVSIPIKAPTASGKHVITADIASEEMVFRHWLDAIVVVP
ncbi:MAG: MBL fold metallo-hydrolase [Fuerstiella sp.]